MAKRATAFIKFLLARPESTMAVVSHNDLLCALFRSPAMSAPPRLRDKKWGNGDVVALALCH